MKIPILDLRGQYQSIKKEIDSAIKKVVDSQDFILGDEVSALEREIAVYCGTNYTIGVASGTDAIILSLKALGIKEGDEVITTPFTFFATAESISILGARPVFVDIDPGTFNINTDLIEKAINKRTKAIIPVHLYGQCAYMDPIMKLSEKYGLKIVEDACQSIGSSYMKKKAGSIGDAGCLSFFPSKNLGAFGDGGMVVTNDRQLAELVRTLRVHGSSVRYIHSRIGMNSRLDNLQAAIVRVKLKYLDRWVGARQKNAEYYNERLKGLPLAVPYAPDYTIHTYHQYVLRAGIEAETVIKRLGESGIESRTYYPVPLHLQECYRDLGYKKGDLPESELASKRTFAIAVYPEMSREQMDFMVNALKMSVGDN